MKNTFVFSKNGVTKIVEIRDLTSDELNALITDNSFMTKGIDLTGSNS